MITTVLFFGGPNDRRVDAVFFIVDAFPVVTNDFSNEQIDDESLLRQVSDDASLISRRIAANTEYLDKWHLEEVLQKTYNPRTRTPCAVRLLVNKCDLLLRLIESGGMQFATPEEYVVSVYADVIDRIRVACAKNNIGDFSCKLVSAATGTNSNEIVQAILEQYFSPKE